MGCSWVVIRMVWATLFFLGFCVVVFGGVVLLARGRSGTSITGPQDREIDYDNPYGLGGYLWTTSRVRYPPPQRDRMHGRAADLRGRDVAWRPVARQETGPGVSEGPLPARLPLDTGFRAAYFMAERYVLEHGPDDGLILFLQYLSSDPARWDDWKQSVRHALKATGTEDPLVENLDRRE
jgi:hypothetical protein